MNSVVLKENAELARASRFVIVSAFSGVEEINLGGRGTLSALCE